MLYLEIPYWEVAQDLGGEDEEAQGGEGDKHVHHLPVGAQS